MQTPSASNNAEAQKIPRGPNMLAVEWVMGWGEEKLKNLC